MLAALDIVDELDAFEELPLTEKLCQLFAADELSAALANAAERCSACMTLFCPSRPSANQFFPVQKLLLYVSIDLSRVLSTNVRHKEARPLG